MAAPTAPELPDSEPPVRRDSHRSFTIAATGDILIHSQVWEQAAAFAHGREDFDFRPMFSKVRKTISAADLAICHMETPLSGDDHALSSFPVFDVPHEVADAIAWAGYDECSTASNHSIDQGSGGVKDTIDALDDAGVSHAGTARNKKESRRITFIEVNGVKVAHLSYAYGFNGFSPDNGWEVNRIDPGRIAADAKRARNQGSEFTIVSLHWGTEYVTAPTQYQRQVADKLVRSKYIDLLIGHHAHVVQPIAREGGKVVVYGMGNFLSGMTPSPGHEGVEDGVIVQIDVRERGAGFVVDDVSYVPTWVEPGSWRVVAAQGDSYRRTVGAIASMGADRAGVRPARPGHR